MDELLGDFLTETAEHLQAVDEQLVRWEQAPDDRATLDAIFRLVHTVKGTCGFLNLPRLERLAHAAETVLGRVRDGRIEVNRAVVTEVLAAIDAIKAMLRTLEATGREGEGDDAALIARLQRAADGELQRQPEPAPEAVEADAADVKQARAASTIRVSVDLLERMMTSVSELVLTRNQLLQIARQHEGDAYAPSLQRLSSQIGELQEHVMRTRMQPVANAWSGLPRMLRNLTIELDKPIELEMSGGDTELDRQLLEQVKDPLAHMVRNAADHGIEPIDVRQALGKRPTGRIKLDAYQAGGHVVIELSDDGRGLDLDRLKAKAVEAGILTSADVERLNRSQIERLIFHPGLSTAERITSVSGRGVGMDIVKANIERIGGIIDIESAQGRGTRFTIRIPLTLAILPALIVGSGGERFALPQMGVTEIVDVSEGCEHRIEWLHWTPVLRLRGRLLPIIDLASAFGLPAPEILPRQVVVVQAGNQSFGLAVEDLFDTEEVVVKPVASVLGHLQVYAGNAILGDGQVIMILDLNGIATQFIDASADQAFDDVQAGEEEAAKGERDSMLLFREGDRWMAVPLALVARIEEVDADQIEWSVGRPVIQYRGGMLPLMTIEPDGKLVGAGRQPVLVFANGDDYVGLAVEKVIDVVEDVVELRMTDAASACLGSAIIGGRIVDVVDVSHYLRRSATAPLAAATGEADLSPRARVLVIDDSAFFRNMLRPLLEASGYQVQTAATADEAIRLRNSGARFDLILSDIEMPGQSGIEFARTLRSGENGWSATPLVALSSLVESRHLAQGRAAGFDDYVPKFDRDLLLGALERQLQRRSA